MSRVSMTSMVGNLIGMAHHAHDERRWVDAAAAFDILGDVYEESGDTSSATKYRNRARSYRVQIGDSITRLNNLASLNIPGSMIRYEVIGIEPPYMHLLPVAVKLKGGWKKLLCVGRAGSQAIMSLTKRTRWVLYSTDVMMGAGFYGFSMPYA